MEPLDNPIWHAPTTVQAPLAEVRGDAARFPAAMTPLAGLRGPSIGALDDLAALVAASSPIGLFLDRAVALYERGGLATRGRVEHGVVAAADG